MNKDHHILIGTPAYNGHLHVDYFHSIMNFMNHGIQHSVMTIGNESLITRARNSILAAFWGNPMFTHLLFLDADVFLDHEGLKAMIKHDKDVIGAPVYLKGKDEAGNQTFNTDADANKIPSLQVVNRVGTAALLLSRKAVGSMVNHAIAQNRTYQINQSLRNDNVPDTHYDVFRVGIANDEYLSEDFWVCKELKELGFDIYVDTAIYTRHNGMVAFD